MTTTLDAIFEPPVLGWHRWRRRLAVAVTLVVLAAGATWAVRRALASCGGPASGITEIDGECVGVSDGSYTFFPASDVESRIREENVRVTRVASETGARYVDVALLSPLAVDPASPGALSEDQIRHTLQGAYTALVRANQPRPDPDGVGFGDDGVPLIRLLLANEGSHQRQWAPVVDRLQGMTGGDHPLVAVVGLGVSVEETRLAATSLSRAGIPMVGAIISADELDHDHIPGLIRVSPRNADYVDALAHHLGGRPELRRGMIVYDANATDLYTRNLKEDFERQLAGHVRYPSKAFSGYTEATGATPARFAGIVSSICNVQPDMVFFAGREVDLDLGFVDALRDRECRDSPVTVLTGVTGFSTVAAREDVLRDARITITYAAPVDAEAWAAGAPGTPRYYPDFERVFLRWFRKADLVDSYAIMSHDALATAVKAIRGSVEGGELVPAPADVRGVLLNLSSGQEVRGASGTLSFSDLGRGNPEGKPIPIRQVPAPPPGTPPPAEVYTTPSRSG